MEYTKSLKTLVWLNITTFIFYLALVAGGYTTPQSLANCETDIELNPIYALTIFLVILVFTIVGLIGIYKTKNYGRVLYLCATILMLAAVITTGNEASTALGSFIDYFSSLLEGALIAMCWLPKEAKIAFENVNVS